MQQLIAHRRFSEHVDAATLLAVLGPALRDQKKDNDRDIYRACLTMIRRLCTTAPAVVPRFLDSKNQASLLPALSFWVGVQPKEDAIPQEVRAFACLRAFACPLYMLLFWRGRVVVSSGALLCAAGAP